MNPLVDIDSLPNEIILKIFAYLTQNQVGQIARVCKRWSELTKSPVLWRNINVKFSPSHRSQNAISRYFINRLPPCVTCARFDFGCNKKWKEALYFEEFCLRLQKKCPHLNMLFLIESKLSDSDTLQKVVDLCTQYLDSVRTLIFHCSTFSDDPPEREFDGTSKIEALELYGCYLKFFVKLNFSKMPRLNQLRLSYTYVKDRWFEGDTSFLNNIRILDLGFTLITSRTFQAIQNNALNLKELYLCNADLGDDDFIFNNSSFPCLEIVCLSNCWGVTCEGVVSLIQSCNTLQIVYVTPEMAVSYASHDFVAANECKLGIVKFLFQCYEHRIRDNRFLFYERDF